MTQHEPFIHGAAGKKPTKVQARKLAREARLEQRIDGRPAGQDAMPRQPMQMQQRTDRQASNAPRCSLEVDKHMSAGCLTKWGNHLQ